MSLYNNSCLNLGDRTMLARSIKYFNNYRLIGFSKNKKPLGLRGNSYIRGKLHGRDIHVFYNRKHDLLSISKTKINLSEYYRIWRRYKC